MFNFKSIKIRFNKPILADIVGEAARNILQSINDAPIMSGTYIEICAYVFVFLHTVMTDIIIANSFMRYFRFYNPQIIFNMSL